MLAASAEPSAEPAPMMVCSSSMNRMTLPSCFTSSMALLMRSSKSPRYLVPATMPVKSRDTRRLFFSSSGTSPAWIFRAKPSATAVLPTPGSPMSTGLFLVRRHRIWMTRSISFWRPMTGSILPWAASWVKSRPNCSRALPVWPPSSPPPGRASFCLWKPVLLSMLESSATMRLGSAPKICKNRMA